MGGKESVMGVTFGKGAGKKSGTGGGQKAGGAPAAGGGKKNVPSFMKVGKAAQTALAQDTEKAAAKAAQADQTFRFWIPPETDTSITFLDGKLDEDGVLDAPIFHEHQLFLNQSWKNWFVCVAEQEPCPICESGDEAKLVAAFTIIDHSEFEGKKGTYKDTIKLFVCKRDTYKLLQKIAEKRGGLAGATFDVSRTSKNDASVGNVFDFTEKRTKKQLCEAYPSIADRMGPLDYEKEFPYLDAASLREMGFGSTPTGGEPHYSQHETTGGGDTSNYDDEL